MNEPPFTRRRGRSWWRSRRLITVVVLVDMLGGAALAYALTRNSPTPSKTASAPVTLTARPQDPLSTPLPALDPTAARSKPGRSHTPGRARTNRAEPAGSSDAQASFERFSAAEPGQVGLAVAPLGQGPILIFGALQVGHAWSTMKVPVLTTVLSQMQQRGEVLDSQGRDYATRALEASDNSAAEALFAGLQQTDGGLQGASSAVQDTLRRAGDRSTDINTVPNNGGFTTWGQSEWTASGEVMFYRSLARGCLLSTANTRYVLGLMQNVESDQRWGAGSAGYPSGLPLQFKGGWGPENGAGYLVRQSAIIGAGNQGYVLSMLAKPSNGAFSTGTQMLTQLAAWTEHAFQMTETHPAATCG